MKFYLDKTFLIFPFLKCKCTKFKIEKMSNQMVRKIEINKQKYALKNNIFLKRETLCKFGIFFEIVTKFWNFEHFLKRENIFSMCRTNIEKLNKSDYYFCDECLQIL